MKVKIKMKIASMLLLDLLWQMLGLQWKFKWEHPSPDCRSRWFL